MRRYFIACVAAVAVACMGNALAQTSYDEPEIDPRLFGRELDCVGSCGELDLNIITFESILKKPVGDVRVSSGYGWRFHPILKKRQFHHGVDFSTPIGTPVRAGQRGKVVFAGWMNGYGKLLIIKHDNTYSTVYAHLHSFEPGVTVGALVKKGQVVAKSGNTGRSTGPHLHYEIRVDGLAVHHGTGESGSPKVLVFKGESIGTPSAAALVAAQRVSGKYGRPPSVKKAKASRSATKKASKQSSKKAG